MRNLEQQARRILNVYLERGQTALAELRSDNVDAALAILRLRKAAFHNFRAIDALAVAQGLDLNSIPDFAGLFIQLQSLDIHLTEEMLKARELAGEQAHRLNAARRKISKYRSTVDSSSRFEQSV